MRALDRAWAHWQLSAQVQVKPCGCRSVVEVDTGTDRRVATCSVHRRGVGGPLVIWAPM